MLISSVTRFLEWQDDCDDILNYRRDIILTSGGFDPLHVGHLRCIQGTVKIAHDASKFPKAKKPLVVILVNCDDFLKAKKGYAFMPLEDRMEIINGLKGVDVVIPWRYTNDDFTVVRAIDMLKPKYFTKGGDRTDATNIPEWEICFQRGCEIITGVGGGKIRSSSDLVEKADRFNLEATELAGWAEGYGEGRDSQ